MSNKFFNVIIFPTCGHRFWWEMSSYICSSKENIKLIILEYLKENFDYEISTEKLKTVLSVGIEDYITDSITDIFYGVTKEKDRESHWRIKITECEIDKYN